jgi:hypothetical protein
MVFMSNVSGCSGGSNMRRVVWCRCTFRRVLRRERPGRVDPVSKLLRCGCTAWITRRGPQHLTCGLLTSTSSGRVRGRTAMPRASEGAPRWVPGDGDLGRRSSRPGPHRGVERGIQHPAASRFAGLADAGRVRRRVCGSSRPGGLRPQASHRTGLVGRSHIRLFGFQSHRSNNSV